ncbi:MAG: PEGA domain-containing protein [Betaproteobacteria bacterium]
MSRSWSAIAMAALVPAWLLTAAPSAFAQAAPRGGGGGGASHGGGGGAPHSGGAVSGGGASGGSSQPAGGGTASGGGSYGGGVSHAGGGARSSGGARGWSAGGGSGFSRGGGERHVAGGSAVQRGSGAVSSGTSSQPATGTSVTTGYTGTRDRARPRGEGGLRTNDSGAAAGEGIPPYSRPRDGRTQVGTAVPRTGAPAPPSGGGGGIFVPGGYYNAWPWVYGGLGFYGGYYDPWYWGGGYGYGYGYGAGSYDYGGDYYGQQYSPDVEGGALRLKVKPREAQVFVDGYYAGVVDDFDGVFQRLQLDAGSHRIEIRAPGYETLTIDVRIDPGHTTTYQGELQKIQ